MWAPRQGGESTSFKFNFGGDGGGEDADDDAAAAAAARAPAADVVRGVVVDAADVPHPAPGWIREDVRVELGRDGEWATFIKGASSGTAAALKLRGAREDVADADVVKGKYEGGFKLWECAVDLVRFIMTLPEEEEEDDASASASASASPSLSLSLLRGASVLELGCGHGLPAIAAATRGAKRVVFADYNPEVLSSLTIPNVRANFAQLYDAANAAAAPPPSTSFVGGDWSDLPRFVPRASADVVLAAETIYAPESYDAHVAALTHAMKARSHSHWSPYDRVRVVNAVP